MVSNHFFIGLLILETYTTFLDKLTKEYHLDDKIAFPDDYKENLTNFEAEIGLYQLDYYDKIVLHKEKLLLCITSY